MISTKSDKKSSNINSLLHKDNLDNEIFIFDDIRDISLPEDPIKLEMPIFAICTSGVGYVKINLTEYRVEPRSLVTLLPNHILHGYHTSDDFKAIFISVSSKYVSELIPDIHTLLPIVMNFKESPITQLTEDEVDSLKEFHKFLWERISKANSEYRKKSISHLLQALLFETLDIYGKHKNIASTKRSRNEEIFYSFFQLVERNFKVDRSVTYYANLLCITPKHLSAVVKAVSGQTAGDWIDNYVILASKVLLRSSSQTIQEISLELNFANQSFFGKYFKKHVGISPSQYRLGSK